jgi:hypothetical protein
MRGYLHLLLLPPPLSPDPREAYLPGIVATRRTLVAWTAIVWLPALDPCVVRPGDGTDEKSITGPIQCGEASTLPCAVA